MSRENIKNANDNHDWLFWDGKELFCRKDRNPLYKLEMITNYKPPHKNSKAAKQSADLCSHTTNEDESMCSHYSYDTCGDGSIDDKGVPLKAELIIACEDKIRAVIYDN